MNNQPPATGNNSKQSAKPQEGAFNVQKKSGAKESLSHDNEQNDVESINGNSNGHSDDQWKAKIGSAKQQWNKLQQEELVATCGNSDQLSTLVQKRYSMNKADADKQVKEFFNKH